MAGPLCRFGHPGTAEPGQEFLTFVVGSDNRHNVFILKEVKYVSGQSEFRFVFGLVGHIEHFGHRFGAGNDRLDHVAISGDIDGLRRLHREIFAQLDQISLERIVGAEVPFLLAFDETVRFVFAGRGPMKPLEQLFGDADFGMLPENRVEISLDSERFDVASALIIEQLGGSMENHQAFWLVHRLFQFHY